MKEKKKERTVLRGDVFMADLHLTGNLQRGKRPYLIVSNNLNNRVSPVVSVVALTTRRKKHLPVHTNVTFYNHVQKREIENTVLCEQLYSINKSYLEEYVAHVKNFKGINKALKIHLGL